jgi:putative PIN family toxin of toxin-antitoxin system
MRAVLDTNVLLSGLLWGGTPRAFIKLARIGRLSLVTSPHLLAEFAGIMTRARFRPILARRQIDPISMLADLRRVVILTDAQPLPEPVCRNPDDDVVLAVAVAANVGLIVSGDADLLVPRNYAGIPIMTPAQAVAMFDS